MKRPRALIGLLALHAGPAASADDAREFIHETGRKRRLRGTHPPPSHNIDPQGSRRLTKVSPEYLEAHPYYPNHDRLTCLSDNRMPEWMTWEGGYAEAHLFASGEDCCKRWFPEIAGCGHSDGTSTGATAAALEAAPEGEAPDVAGVVSNVLAGEEDNSWALRPPSDNGHGNGDHSNGGVGSGAESLIELASNNRPAGEEEIGALEGMTYRPTSTDDLGARPAAAARPAGDAEEESAASSSFEQLSVVERPTGGEGSSETEQYLGAWQVSPPDATKGHGAPVPETHDPLLAMGAGATEQTFPTSSCGHGWEEATTCTTLCLDGRGCPGNQLCHAGVHCPAGQVAAAMGEAGASILSLIHMDDELRGSSVETNVCGVDYADAESKCRAGEPLDDGSPGIGFSDDFVDCNDYVCPGDMHCYGGILCPLPPTISPRPTRAPVPHYSFNHAPTEEGGHGKSIVAYYAAWQYYDRNKLAQPRNLNYNMVTRINYAFFQTDIEGNVWGTDDFADPTLLYGDIVEQNLPAGVGGGVCSPSTLSENAEGCYCHNVGANVKTCQFHEREGGLIHLAHANGVEVYPSIGGWTLSDAFPTLSASQSGREGFAASCIELILMYDFDGIDIDWEYPGYTAHSGTPADRENFVLLLRTVRSALDALGAQTNRRYGLTAALPCGPSNIANQDIEEVASILDELNLMTYDFHGSWDPITGHNAPLYDQPGDPEGGWSVDGCVNNWVGDNSPIADLAVRKEYHSKVNIGMPFYGRSYLDTTDMYTPHGGNDEYSWEVDEGTPQYFNIKARLEGGGMTSVRDDVTKTEWAYFNSGYGMISYDDERSICDKTEYALDHGLGGFIIWEISGDMMDDMHQPLLEAMNRKLALPDTDCEDSFGRTVSQQADEPSEPSPIVDAPIERGDKTEIVGIPVMPPPAPAPEPAMEPAPATSNASPYTIDTSTFGPNAVAAESCTGGCPGGSSCVGNSAGGQLILDSDCTPCNSGQTWWPCDVEGMCWCWNDGTDRIAPAPPSGLEVETTQPYYTICNDILTRELFYQIAPEAREPYTYEGLCDAILSYNAHHTEKAFGMGDAFQRAAELAAFMGNTLHESDEFRAGREYLMCGDNKVVDGEVYCKPCDPGSFDWGTFTCNHSLISGTSDFNEYCQPSSLPPEACHCGSGVGEGGSLDGYVAARHLFFGRGAIQLSWNYNYIGASVALTGSPDTFCDNPDIVATEGKYAWGAGLYFWMEHVKEGTTSHMEALNDGGDFGGTLNNINGGLECPAHGGWHVDAVKMRLNRYCRAAKALNLPNLMRIDNCAGLQESMDTCLSDGMCDECLHFVGSVPGEHPKWVAPASAPATVATQVAEPVAPPAASLCPDGLMPWDGNSDCCVPNPNVIGDGACDPEAPYNTPACGFDGGDCCKNSCDRDTAFGCTTKEDDSLGEYGPFGFFCVDPSQGADVINSKLCDVDEKYRIGDGMCNALYNTPECNWDGGDCCEETCDSIFSFFTCGSGAQGYDCLDPRFRDTDQPTSHPTQRPTTRNPTHAPTRSPVEEPPLNADIAAETEAPQEQTTAMKCNEAQKECPGGTFVGRNPDNKCRFHPCPPATQGSSQNQAGGGKHSFASSISSALHGKNNYKEDDKPKAPKPQDTKPENTGPPRPANNGGLPKCRDDARECSDGSFVRRNPANKCRFHKCAAENTDNPAGSKKPSSFGASINSPFPQDEPSFPQDEPEPNNPPPSGTTCRQDKRECSNGKFVGRDPNNRCEWMPCDDGPKQMSAESDEPQSAFSSLAASLSSLGQESAAEDDECTDELRPCRDGSFVRQNPDLGCAYDPCPANAANDLECTDEVMKCDDGTFVTQDPDNRCEYFPCPEEMVSLAAQMHAKYSSVEVQCTNELFMCAEGVFVAQDPDNGCEYFPCEVPPTRSPTQRPTNGMNTQTKCQNDLRQCPDGTYVARDPDDACEFLPCSEMNQMMAFSGGGAPHKKKKQNAYAGGGAQSQHRKKNRSE